MKYANFNKELKMQHDKEVIALKGHFKSKGGQSSPQKSRSFIKWWHQLHISSIWMINISFFLIKKNIGGITHHRLLGDAPHIVIVIVVPFVIDWMPTHTRVVTIVQLTSVHHYPHQLVHITLPLFWVVNELRYVEVVKRVGYFCCYFTVLSEPLQHNRKYLTSWLYTTLSQGCCLLIAALTLPSLLLHYHLGLLKVL